MDIDALVGQLSQAEASVAHEAVKAAAALPKLDACRDAEQLQQMPPVPDDLDSVHAVRRELARARALRMAGRFAEGIEVARAAVDEARGLEWAPLAITGEVLLGTLLDEGGDSAKAEALLEGAYFEARELGLSGVALAAANRLVYTVGHRNARGRDGRWWARHVEVALAHAAVDESGLARGEAWSNLATIELMEGNLEAARAGYEKDLALRERLLGPNHPEVAESLSNVAVALAMMARYAEARPLFERALAIQESALGPEHPSVAVVLNNLGGILEGTGETAAAIPVYRRALAIQEEVAGREHPGTANILHSLGNALAAVDETEEARAHYERALAIWESTLGPDHPDVALPLNTLGMLDARAGDLSRAQARIERALAVLEAARGPDHPEVGASLTNLADVYAARGDHERARTLHARSLAILEAAMGPDHPNLGVPLRGLISLALAEGRAGDAIAPAQRAVDLAVADPLEQAQARFLLAKALAMAPETTGGEKNRAIELAVQARDALAGHDEAQRLEIEAWLGEHGGEP